MTQNSSPRSFSLADKLIFGFDHALRTVSPGSIAATRTSPAAELADNPDVIDNYDLRKHISGLMRINHTGEVCAQALYQGQALTARATDIRQAMQQSADEEEDHLAWCEQRLQQLDSHTSYLNPLFYAMSFGIGATAGLVGDKWSLGFIAATEDQVCAHLRDHLRQVPEQDQKTRAILDQMLIDEEHHGNKALNAGGLRFNELQKQVMTAMSKVMTRLTYRI